MKKFFIMFISLLLLSLLVTGCINNNPNQNEDPTEDNITTTEPNKSDDNKDKDNDEINNHEEPKLTTFNDAFPEGITEDPDRFMKDLIPGFKLGLTKTETKNLLGEPISIEKSKLDWGDNEDWHYEDINGYSFTVTFDAEDKVINFRLIKELSGKGEIPRITNESIPSNGDVLTYSDLGFEGVLLGTSLEDVLNKYGEPLQTYISHDEMYGYTLSLVYQGVTVNLLLNTDNDKTYVQFIETNNLGEIETIRGIKIGVKAEEVVEKYGSVSYDWKEVGDLIYATEEYWFAIKFQIEDGMVTAINIYEAS